MGRPSNVSVIVTTYNRPIALICVLEGLALQERAPDEVIVADDGSAPDTGAAIEAFRRKAAFPVLHVRHEDRGFRLAKIRNEAVKKAKCDYLVIMDGDCVPNEHFVGDHMDLSEKGFFVQGKRILLNEKSSGSFTAYDANSPFKLIKRALSGDISNRHHLLRMPFSPAMKNVKLKGIKGCNMSFFRLDIIAVNGYNEAITGWGREDSELAARLFKYGLKRKEHPFMAICFHLWHPEGGRDCLVLNDEILKKTLLSDNYRCMAGIVKDPLPGGKRDGD